MTMAERTAPAVASRVLAVDMDGTLLRTDAMFECIAALLKRPWALITALCALVHGRAAFKAALAKRVTLDVASLPLDERFVAWLRDERAQGRTLALYSAADASIVTAVARRVGVFDDVQGSDGRTNLRGAAKYQALRARYGSQFTYAGDSMRDIPIWSLCKSAVIVGAVRDLQRRLASDVEIAATFAREAPGVRTWLAALRVHQWAKNALIFVPLVLSGMVSGDNVAASMLAFVAFGLVASATYIMNDLADLPLDRAHPMKHDRPFASGALSIRAGLMAAPVLLIAAAAITIRLPNALALVLASYLLVTLLYSLRVKEVPVLDLMVLAFLFTMRIVGGMTAIDAPTSPWLLTFSMFFFASIAAMKRYDEVRLVGARGASRVAGRGYRAVDATLLMVIGVASAVASTLVFVIYLVEPDSPARDFARPQLMWIICAILAYWLGRAWLLSSRGAMHVDPVAFALKDRVSLALGMLTLALSIAARFA
jgi:4-hydroxybenzoate polyprenyltransferase/phosphoserine phosphatase